MCRIACLALIVLGLGWVAPRVEAGETFVMKIMAINPSTEQTQRAEVKAYLPNEVTPEDVIEQEDLEVAYDTQQGAYYVHGIYELKPGETREWQIEIKDIWTIPTEELEALRQEAAKTVELLAMSGLQERASFFKGLIESKLDKITERQRVPAVNPERHISDHRDNLRLLESAKADLLLARSLLVQAEPKTALPIVWKLFVGIVIFLGMLGLMFYIVWQRQLKTITATTFVSEPSAEEARMKTPEGRDRKAREEQAGRADDIEKLIKDL